MGTQRLPAMEPATPSAAVTIPVMMMTTTATGSSLEAADDLLFRGSSSTVEYSPTIHSTSSSAPASQQNSPSHSLVMLDQPPTVLSHDNLRIKSVFVRRYLKHNPLINCLLPLACLCALVVIVYLLKDFPKHALNWIERRQEASSWTLICWFMVLFVVVSFPVTVGYLVLIITSGYLFGFFQGLLVVVVGANSGVAVAHYVIKSLQNKLPVHK